METAGITIRSGKLDELETFADFWLAMFEEIGMISERDMTLDWRRQFRAYFERRIGDGEARFFVACDDDGAIAGTSGAIVADGYPFAIHGIRRGYVFGVRVAPEFRRRGVALDLTQAAVAWLRDVSCKKIRLHASPFGKPIYERLGFTPTNEMEVL